MSAAPALVIATAGLAACGSSAEQSTTTPTTAAAAAGGPSKQQQGANAGKQPGAAKGTPDALAANRAQANQILPDGSLDSKLAELEGNPVVVNQWASWCPPCRAEFPYFQQSADTHADDVAFVGIDQQGSVPRPSSSSPTCRFPTRASTILPRPRSARSEAASSHRRPCSSTRAARWRMSSRAPTSPRPSSKPTSTSTC